MRMRRSAGIVAACAGGRSAPSIATEHAPPERRQPVVATARAVVLRRFRNLRLLEQPLLLETQNGNVERAGAGVRVVPSSSRMRRMMAQPWASPSPRASSTRGGEVGQGQQLVDAHSNSGGGPLVQGQLRAYQNVTIRYVPWSSAEDLFSGSTGRDTCRRQLRRRAQSERLLWTSPRIGRRTAHGSRH